MSRNASVLSLSNSLKHGISPIMTFRVSFTMTMLGGMESQNGPGRDSRLALDDFAENTRSHFACH